MINPIRSLPTGMNRSFYARHMLSIILIATMFLSGCRPATSPISEEPTPETISSEETVPTATSAGLSVTDDGAPLPIQIIETEPLINQSLPTNGRIKLVFNQAMDIEKTSAAWKIVDSQGDPVDGEIKWSSPRTLVFTPKQSLEPGSEYNATIGNNAASQQGMLLEEKLEFSFATSSPLQVSQVFPEDKSKDIANNAVITVIFNRPVVPLVVSQEKAEQVNPLTIKPELAGEGEWVNTSVFAFQPSKPLKADTNYQITVKAGLADAGQDTELAEDFSWSFSTAKASIKSFSLSDGRENPKNFSRNILLTEKFSINFLQPMQHENTENAISLATARGEQTLWDAVWNQESTTVTLTPQELLALDTQYTLTVSESAQAADGAQLDEGLEWTFYTIPSPAVIGFSPTDRVKQEVFSAELRIRFASPMNIESVKERIVISPTPVAEVNWWYNEWDWSISSYSLKPSTNYEVKLLAGMQDIYGNEIPVTQTYRFTTAAHQPSAYLEMPYQTPILRQGGPQEFYVAYRNVTTVLVKLYRVSIEQYIAFQSGAAALHEYRPSVDDMVWQEVIDSRGSLNERVLENLQPKLDNDRKLENGIYFLAIQSPDLDNSSFFDDYRLLIVASASLNFKSSATDGLVWLTDLDSGEPIANIPVTVYSAKFKPIGKGTTDSDGLAHLQLPQTENYYENRYVVAQSEQVFALTSTDWGSGVNVYDYGIWGSYFSPANQPVAYVYTERPIYRPGQPVYFKGIVRLEEDLEYKLPEFEKVSVTVESFKDMVHMGDYSLNSMGSFAGEFTLSEETTLGNYTLNVFLPGKEEAIGTLYFNVAEYRRPEFQVTVSSEPQNTLNGDTFEVTVQADYYSGGGVSAAQLDWTLTKEDYRFTPPDPFAMFSFDDYEEYQDFYEGEGSGLEIIAEGQGTTDDQGAYTTKLPVNLGTSGSSQRFTFEANITDIAQNLVSGRASVIAHRSQVYPGIRSTTYISEAGEPITFEMVALDWDGIPIPGQTIAVEFLERRWYSVQEQDAEGRVTWKSTVEEIPIESLENLVTDSQGYVKAEFIPPNGGVFRARVKSLDSRENLGQASTYVWVASEDFIPWRQTNDRSFDLVTDRNEYQPGENAEILIASPFQGEAYALVTVERGALHYQDVVLLTSNSTLYQLPITPQMAPNVYISVLIVKGVDENNPRPNFKMGIKEIQVDASQVALKVEVSADPPQAGPGDTVRFNIRTMDFSGKPTQSEVSLGLSDLATLSLMEPNSPPMIDFFYAQRNLGVWTSVPITLDIEDYNQNIREEIVEGQGMGGGGGEKGMGELGVIDVRQEFPDTAFWEAFVVTGEDGQANISVTLPDNLTTWRMDARAVTEATLVGQTVLDLVSSKPLLVRPQTPRFLIAGDRVRFGAAIQNNTSQLLQVTASLDASGVNLLNSAAQTVEIKANSQAYITWDANVQPTATRVDLVFLAESGELRDATRPTMGTLDNQGIPVYKYTVPETVGTSGMLTNEGSVLEAIHLPFNLDTTQGSLDVRLSHSLAAGMTDSLTYLKEYPFDCLEQTISRFLPNVLTTQALKASGLSDPNLETELSKQVAAAVQQISSKQNANGGWGWWGGEKSDPLTSAYVVLGLVEAQNAGYEISSQMLTLGIRYLQTQILSSVRLVDTGKINRQAFLLYVLNRAGKPDISSSVQLFEHRQNASYYARALLAQTLFEIDAEDSRVDTLLSDLNSAAILSASGTHWEEAEADRWNWNTDTRTTAIVLSALVKIDPENPLNANAVRWLMTHRNNGHWNGTQETAWTLMALTHWMNASGELQADYQYGVALNGEQVGGGVADSASIKETVELKIDIGQLVADEANRLLIARDEGSGNLYYTAHMNVWLPVDQVKALDQGLIVTRSYYRTDDLQTPVSVANHGELLLARLTLVAPNAVHYLVLNDPLPAGLEAVDQSLRTSPQSITVPQEYSWEDIFWRGWGWWHFDQFQYRDERVVLSADYLPAGTYIYTYLVRAGTVGEFYTIPPTAQEFYFPDVYGRGDGSIFTVNPID
ncbi:MAG TPA: Ig-like domain-containing protein [Anaerolineales bacterium]|nr:Ig-like domain-containing protein [Anaerolineales bacterium]